MADPITPTPGPTEPNPVETPPEQDRPLATQLAAQPSAAVVVPKKGPKKGSWADMKVRANRTATVVVMLTVVAGIGAAVGFEISVLRNPPAAIKPTEVETLSSDELKKLADVGSSLGNTGQVLNIGADALFRRKVDVGGDLTVGGRFNANGPVSLSQLNISGATALNTLSVSSNMQVGGLTNLQRGATVGELLSVNGGLNVSGSASVSSLNAANISVQNITISGPLTIGHLITRGPAPSASAGTAVGGGGTISISGNDSAGTVNVNTGAGPAAGVLATVVFRAPYGTTVHVLLTPLTGASASLPAYVSRTSTGFQIRTDSPPPAGAVFAFDYFVTQ